MFELIIRYTQQTSEDTWSLRHRSFRSEIPGLEKEMAKISSSSGAHVVDVNKVETPKNKEDSKNSSAAPVQQTHDAIALVCEMKACITYENLSTWYHANLERINAVVAQQHHA